MSDEIRIIQPSTPRVKVCGVTGGEVQVVEQSVPRIKVLFDGPPGRDGTSNIVIDPETGNRLSNGPDGLLVPPVAEGQLTDMVLIFENALL